jgi:hypothetical protein
MIADFDTLFTSALETSTAIIAVLDDIFVGRQVVFAENCKTQNNISIYDEVTFKDESFFGPSDVFANTHNPRGSIYLGSECCETTVVGSIFSMRPRLHDLLQISFIQPRQLENQCFCCDPENTD